jgi:hypothetical protein
MNPLLLLLLFTAAITPLILLVASLLAVVPYFLVGAVAYLFSLRKHLPKLKRRRPLGVSEEELETELWVLEGRCHPSMPSHPDEARKAG